MTKALVLGIILNDFNYERMNSDISCYIVKKSSNSLRHFGPFNLFAYMTDITVTKNINQTTS